MMLGSSKDGRLEVSSFAVPTTPGTVSLFRRAGSTRQPLYLASVYNSVARYRVIMQYRYCLSKYCNIAIYCRERKSPKPLKKNIMDFQYGISYTFLPQKNSSSVVLLCFSSDIFVFWCLSMRKK